MTVALITGATGGLGRALAHEHAKRGGDLILVGRNQMKLASLKAQLHVAYPLVLIETIQADFAKGGQVQQVFDAVQTLGWQVDYLINKALRQLVLIEFLRLNWSSLGCPTWVAFFVPQFNLKMWVLGD